ncbi:hypothetical protein BS17DRAFT_564777 [Gyrodon lividus]|nr:hypothetical protein BS17DRAFT_564777 [Gyrodon lividus]
MSILRQLWQRFLKPTCLVGKDLTGNKYFEYPSTASGRKLPVQWNAWLTHTRPDPPTIEELQADLVRQQRVQMNAAILEARDEEERERTARLAQASHLQVPETLVPELSEAPGDVRPNNPINREVRDPWAEAKKGSGEPESWTPVARQRCSNKD